MGPRSARYLLNLWKTSEWIVQLDVDNQPQMSPFSRRGVCAAEERDLLLRRSHSLKTEGNGPVSQPTHPSTPRRNLWDSSDAASHFVEKQSTSGIFVPMEADCRALA